MKKVLSFKGIWVTLCFRYSPPGSRPPDFKNGEQSSPGAELRH